MICRSALVSGCAGESRVKSVLGRVEETRGVGKSRCFVGEAIGARVACVDMGAGPVPYVCKLGATVKAAHARRQIQGRLSQDGAGWADRGPRALGVDLRSSRDNKWIKCLTLQMPKSLPEEMRGSPRVRRHRRIATMDAVAVSDNQTPVRRGRPHAMQARTAQDSMLAHVPPASSRQPSVTKMWRSDNRRAGRGGAAAGVGTVESVTISRK